MAEWVLILIFNAGITGLDSVQSLELRRFTSLRECNNAARDLSSLVGDSYAGPDGLFIGKKDYTHLLQKAYLCTPTGPIRKKD